MGALFKQNRIVTECRKALLMSVKEKVNSDYKNEFGNFMKSWCLKCIKLINYVRLGNLR